MGDTVGAPNDQWCQRWGKYRNGEPKLLWSHPIIRGGEEGHALRKRIVEGASKDDPTEKRNHATWLKALLEDSHKKDGGRRVPPQCSWVYENYGRKHSPVLGRRVEEQDYVDRGVLDPIRPGEWRDMVMACTDRKASDGNAHHAGLLKSLARYVPEDAAQPNQQLTCRTTAVSDALRLLTGLPLRAGVRYTVWRRKKFSSRYPKSTAQPR